MNFFENSLVKIDAPQTRRLWNHNAISLSSDLLPVSDFFNLLLAASLTLLLYAHGIHADLLFSMHIEKAALSASLLAPFIFYDKQFGASVSGASALRMLRAHLRRFTLFTGVVIVLGWVSGIADNLPPGWMLSWLVFGLLLTSLTRTLLALYLRYLQRQGILTEAIAVVGNGPVADRLVRALHQARPHTIELVGVFDDKIQGGAPSSLKSAGTVEQLIALAKTRKIDWILVTLPATAEERLLAIVQRLKTLSVPVGLCSQHVGLTVPYGTIGYVGDSVPVSLLADRPIKRWDAVVKGAEDFILGGMITLALLPVMAVIALAIKIDSPGPIIFKQRRHAFNNHEFDIYKFRSMRWNSQPSDTLQQTSRQDKRVTRVGRLLRSTSLDELPQLFNVLKGDMSLVGPRPHAINMRTEDRLGHEITDQYAHRHRVKPGITGWSQVNGSRGATETSAQLHRRVELDMHYIENWSLLLDLKILVLTCREVFKRTNAF
ncbi:MAG: undecaprenyl-phosphate glucose phosphotransferase [Gammaproteobacteria bacterium]|nr:undecaprenyl-phosphate glucose phosphotransferase [Gammaproteobacteria bacterium]